MAKLILLDEIHLNIRVPTVLPRASAGLAVRTLKSKRFQTNLRKAIIAFFHRQPSLRIVKVSLSR